MKRIFYKVYLLTLTVLILGCADNTLEEEPKDDNFPFQLVLDADEGAALPDEEEYDVELKFADHLSHLSLPASTIFLDYNITDIEGDMAGTVIVDKIVYEVEIDDCVYERELLFVASADGLSGTIEIAPDVDLGSVPEAFELIFLLPALEETEGSFKVEFSNLVTDSNLLLGSPNVFEYSVLDSDVAGEWEMEIKTEDEFEKFKEVFAPLNPTISELTFEDITGTLEAEFEFEEMTFTLELVETEEVVTCEDGEEETEIVNKVIEIEAEYDADDGEIEFEGSHEIVNDEGIVEEELDFIMKAEYEEPTDILSITFFSVIDEDHFEDGDELFISEDGTVLSFEKD